MGNVMMALVAAIAVVDCPKCDKRFRVADDGSVTVNEARLKDDAPDAATLRARKSKLLARADEYRRRARNRPDGNRKCPLMGWSSWNTFALDINEELIVSVAEAMATNGLKEAGYRYVNIDDGFFVTHDETGKLVFHPDRFPDGLKGTVDRIHKLGLKAGIYSDAGEDTCGSIWGGGTDRGDETGAGAGLYGHDAADCKLYFKDTGFDFIKVDYCGGARLKLDERKRYTEISKAIAATGREVRFNVCRWAYPGTWISGIADSWRTTGDIRANWRSLKAIIADNLYLSAYASPGHYNDMDMLEVGHLKGKVKTKFGADDEGFTPDEETTHFGLWCMFSSPLLIGCDVRTMDTNTLRLVTNPFLLAMNQNNGLGVQGEVVQRDGEAYVIAKDADERDGRSRYAALYNSGDKSCAITLKAAALGLGGEIAAFDLVERADVGTFTKEVTVTVAPHATKFYRLDAEERLERSSYEAESAFLTAYHELPGDDKLKANGLVCVDQVADASLGAAVINLGGNEGNDLVWKNVKIVRSGARTLEFHLSAEKDASVFLEIDGKDRRELKVKAGKGFAAVRTEAVLTRGVHSVRLFSKERMPSVDRLVVVPLADGWRPAYAPLMTEWGEKVTPANAWREYPRPQMVRANWTNLNGLWDYAIEKRVNRNFFKETERGEILVPYCFESALSGVGRVIAPDEKMVYRRTIEVHPKPGMRQLLNFEAVDWRAQVFVNGVEADLPHEGGNLPFTVDITDFVKDGANELKVVAWDPTHTFINAGGKQDVYTQGCFYTRVSGIWQTVWMEEVPEKHIKGYKVTTDIDNSTVKFEFDLAGGGDVVVKIDGVSQSGESGESGEVVVKIPNAELWSPEHPKLYGFTAKCGTDEIRGYFAMRKFDKQKDAKGVWRFRLNNAFYFPLGTLDQGWWPDGLLTPPSEEAMAHDIKTLKALGFNMMRKHIKVEPRRYYHLCDTLGLMVFQDAPSPAGNSNIFDATKSLQRFGMFRREWKEEIDHLFNVPSIVMWIPYNEGWGQPDADYTDDTLRWTKRYDATRLVSGPSGFDDYEGGEIVTLEHGWRMERDFWGFESDDPASDTVDQHNYPGPGQCANRKNRVSLLGEFGGVGLKVKGHMWSEGGAWGYAGGNDTQAESEKRFLELQAKLLPLVKDGLAGTVYTQTTDVELEINGMMTYDRKVTKYDAKKLSAAHDKVRAALAEAVRGEKP